MSFASLLGQVSTVFSMHGHLVGHHALGDAALPTQRGVEELAL